MSKQTYKHSIDLGFDLTNDINIYTQINSSKYRRLPTVQWNHPLTQDQNDFEMTNTESPLIYCEPAMIEKIPEQEYNVLKDIDTDQSEKFDTEIIMHCESENFDEIETYNILYLHKDSNLKLVEVCLLLLAFKNRFTLHDLCFECLLVLIHFFLPFENNLPTSFKKLQKIISTNNEPMKVKRYCSQCQSVVTESTCQNRKCLEISSDLDTFHYISIKRQLKQNLQYFYEQLMSYKVDFNKFADITNSFHTKKFNSDHNYINLMLYSDGVRLRKNKKKFWPVFLSFGDLPLILRDSKSNKIIAGYFNL